MSHGGSNSDLVDQIERLCVARRPGLTVGLPPPSCWSTSGYKGASFGPTAKIWQTRTEKLVAMLSLAAAGPRKFMKIFGVKIAVAMERRGRKLTGVVEAVLLSDPERAFERIIGRRSSPLRRAAIARDPA